MNILSQISRPFAVFVTMIALSWLIAFVLTSFIPAELLTFLGVFAFFALWPMCMAFALATWMNCSPHPALMERTLASEIITPPFILGLALAIVMIWGASDFIKTPADAIFVARIPLLYTALASLYGTTVYMARRVPLIQRVYRWVYPPAIGILIVIRETLPGKAE